MNSTFAGKKEHKPPKPHPTNRKWYAGNEQNTLEMGTARWAEIQPQLWQVTSPCCSPVLPNSNTHHKCISTNSNQSTPPLVVPTCICQVRNSAALEQCILIKMYFIKLMNKLLHLFLPGSCSQGEFASSSLFFRLFVFSLLRLDCCF